MKRKWVYVTFMAMMLAVRANAGSEGTILGALIGAGAGWAIGEHSHHIRTEVAVPVLAVAGGLIGNAIDRSRAPEEVQPQIPTPTYVPAEPAVVNDPHPGIDLIKVSIPLSNGVRVDIPVIRIGDNRFVGPQGEEYDALPTSQMLMLRYGK